MPIGDPKPFVGLVSALAGDLDPNHRLAGIHDRSDDAFDRLGQSRYAVLNRASQMILDGDPAYLREALVDLQAAAVGSKASQPSRPPILDPFPTRLLTTPPANPSL